MNVLILSGQFGLGHEMAARAIGEEVSRLNKNAEVQEVDLFSYFFPRLSRFVFWLFQMMVKHFCGMYNFVYKMSGRMEVDVKPIGFLIYRKLERLMEEYKPDMIVCTHPVCAKSIASYIKKTGSSVALVTCITDISMHPEWVTPQTTAYLVPTREVRESLIEKGIRADKVFVTGIPVRQQFEMVKSADRDSYPHRILIMGGGLGIIPNLPELISMLHNLPGVTATIVAGKNHKLYDEWVGRYEDIHVLGYTESISKLMSESDLVISKVGGITLFELIHCRVPLFVIHPFLEQEVNNARYAEEKGIAKVIWNNSEDFIPILRNFLLDGHEWYDLKENMKYIKDEILDMNLADAMKIVMERESA